MHRFTVYACGVVVAIGAARAFAGDPTPVYLEGVVRSTSWDDPRAEIVVDVAADVTLPGDLPRRHVPDAAVTTDATMLSRAALPKDAPGPWAIDLAPPAHFEAWGWHGPIRVGQAVEVVGYPSTPDARRVRAEVVFVQGRAIPMRSAAASAH